MQFIYLTFLSIINICFNLYWNHLFNKPAPEPRKFQNKLKFLLIPLKIFRIKPNHVTFLGFFSNMLAIYFVFKGIYYLFSTFFILGMFMDLLDGLLARHLKMETKLGKYLDFLADFSSRILILLSLYLKFPDVWFLITLVLYSFYVLVLTLHTLRGKKMIYWFHFEFLILLFPFIGKEIIFPIIISEIFYLPLISLYFFRNIVFAKKAK